MTKTTELQQVFETNLSALFEESDALTRETLINDEAVALGTCMLHATVQPGTEFAGTITATRHFRFGLPGRTKSDIPSVASMGLSLDLQKANDPFGLRLKRKIFVSDGQVTDTCARQLHPVEAEVTEIFSADSSEKTRRLLELIAEKPLAEAIIEACTAPGTWRGQTAPDTRPGLWQLNPRNNPHIAADVQQRLEQTQLIAAAGLTIISFTPQPPLANS
jgi:hypothetical protein